MKAEIKKSIFSLFLVSVVAKISLGFTEHSYVPRISPEVLNLAAHPAQRRLLIEQTLGVPRANRGD